MTTPPRQPAAAPLAPRVAVIGGGVSGLAAAHRLKQLAPQCEVDVWEAGARLGGPLDTRAFGDFFWERGADSFTTKVPAAYDLCCQLGLAEQLQPTQPRQRRALVVCRGQLQPVPEGFVLMRPQQVGGVMRTRVLSLRGKLRLLCEPFVRRRRQGDQADYDESVASFATRRLGRETFERLVQPLLAGIYVADATRLSLAATMPEFLAAERDYGSLWCAPRQSSAAPAAPTGSADAQATVQGARYHAFVTLRQGLSALPTALAASLPPGSVRLQSPVQRVQRHADGRWALEVVDRTRDAAVQTPLYNGVIVAAPAPRAARMLGALDGELAALLGNITYASSVVVNLGYRPQQLAAPLGGFGFVVPEIEGLDIVAASFPSVKFAHRGGTDLTPIRVFLGGAKRPEVSAWDDAQLVAAARRDLEPLIQASGPPVHAEVVRWPESMPQYHVGHVTLVDAIFARLARWDGLQLAGNAYRGVGIPQCVQSGWDAAERLASRLARGAGH